MNAVWRTFADLAGGHILSLHPIEIVPGGDRVWLCSSVDRHERKLREIAFERLATVQTDMLNISMDCIKLISLEGRVVHMNRAGCHALNVPENSSFGMKWLSLLPEVLSIPGEAALTSARSGSPARFPGRSISAEQRTQYWDNLLTPVKDANGCPTAILCVSREVTAEREAQESLRASRERLEFAVNVGRLGVWDFDIRAGALQCDDTWYQIMIHGIRSWAEIRLAP